MPLNRALVLRRAHLVRQFCIVNLSNVWYGILPPIMLVQVARQLRYFGVPSDTAANEACAVLTIGGLFLVAKGYADLRHHFGRKPLMTSARAYLADFVARWKSGNVRVITGTGHVSLGLTGHARATVGAGPNSSLEHRVAVLEQNMAGVHVELGTLASEQEQMRRDLESRIAAERVERERQVQAAKDLLETTTIGGLGSEVTGWIWLLVSALFSGFPQLWVFLVT